MEEKQRVLMISQFFMPDITAAAYRMEDMYEAIKDICSIDIITSFPHKSEVTVTEAETNIFRVNISSKSKNRLVKYLNEYFGFMFKSLFIARKTKKQYEYVFVTSPPIFTLISGYLIAKIKRAKLVIDIRDIWPNVLLDDGTLKENNMIYKMLKKLERFMYQKADRITCVSKYMKQYILEESSREADIIYNGVSKDFAFFDRVRKKANETKKRNIFYTGNLGFFQHFDTLIQTFIQHEDIRSLFHVHVMGSGAKLKQLQDQVIENKLDAFTFYGALNKETTIEMTENGGDILFLNLFHSSNLEKTIPSKLFDYFYFNLPIVYGILGEGRELIQTRECGKFFIWNDQESLYEALMEMNENYDTYLEKSRGNRKFVCEEYNRRKMFREYWMKMISTVEVKI